MNRLMCGLIVVAIAGNARGQEPRVEFHEADQHIDVLIGGELFTSYMYRRDQSKPLLYPVYTPAGVLVCRHYPPLKDESQDHPHHGGIFFAYDRVNGNNFWLNTSLSPHIEHVRFTEKTDGNGAGRLATVSRWIDRDGHPLLEEQRLMVFRAAEHRREIDLNIDLVALDRDVEFGDTKEGVLAIRLGDWMRETFDSTSGVVEISGTGSGEYVSSNGDRTEKEVWGKRANWVCLHASQGNHDVSIAIFDHPSSVNHPTFWHARGYGLFAANPLGQAVFEKTRNVPNAASLGLTLKPGEKAHFQYRVIIADGKLTADALDTEFKAYARP